MCVVSMVFDHYRDKFPPVWPSQPYQPWVNPPINPPNGTPPVNPIIINPNLQQEIDELRQLINDFHEAIDAAKRVDELTDQPDCEDPDKARLTERVDELERKLERIASAAGNPLDGDTPAATLSEELHDR